MQLLKYIGTELGKEVLYEFGLDYKAAHFGEECAELYVALNHFSRVDRAIDMDTLFEEIVDVVILIDHIWEIIKKYVFVEWLENTKEIQLYNKYNLLKRELAEAIIFSDSIVEKNISRQMLACCIERILICLEMFCFSNSDKKERFEKWYEIKIKKVKRALQEKKEMNLNVYNINLAY